ncbi:ATPase [Pseudooceanicola sp. CBS1P-1]|uniref:ATPase n=1 Tax=Pseudooceanicola albus TaxID=2692189 RepID=A0A6L7FYW3_9RHOB|nr:MULTISPECIES: ATP12 family protein [Pseudooceanicola]MBT9382756.1 ATPase [Pseudooceanicola endophyticus]MXN17294.1 ATPase [Pseudooceanicola albus]
MAEWKAKRFWKAATVGEAEGGYTVLLDSRAVKTPAKAALVVPSRALAQALAAEWDAQVEAIDPTTMPITRTVNSAIDKVALQRAEVADLLAEYGDSDLLCYRASHPAELVSRQQDAWDPMLDWAAETLEARLEPRAGIIHAPQDAAALAALRTRVHALDPFELAAFHDLVSLTGSLVLGFAAYHALQPRERLWEISRLDESWQEEQWGIDEEARDISAQKRAAFEDAGRFLELLRTSE